MHGVKIDELNLKSIISLSIGLLFLPLNASPKGDPRSWDEVLLELADLRHEIKTVQVDFDILRDKLHKNTPHDKGVESAKVAALEKRLASLETLFEKLGNDVRALNTSLTQVSKSVGTLQNDVNIQTKLVDDLGALKGTLATISKAMTPEKNSTSYQVKAGDSLSLIAKRSHCTVEEIKKLNPSLKNDQIRIGQELKIPHASP